MDNLDTQIESAIRRGNELAAIEPRAVLARFDAARRRLVVELSTGAELSVSTAMLNLPSDSDLGDVAILGGGFDLFFPRLGEGVFVPDLCRAAFDFRQAA